MDKEEQIEEELIPQRCACCGRTSEMIDILNQHFQRNLTLKRIGMYSETLCSECVSELQQIAFEQVYYGDPRGRVKDLQNKCVAILFNREHPNVDVDEELCSLLVFYQNKIEELKHRGRFSLDDLKSSFHSAMNEWNVTHKYKCTVLIEPLNPTGSKLVIWVRLLIGYGRSDGFMINMELNPLTPGLDTNGIVPFKVD